MKGEEWRLFLDCLAGWQTPGGPSVKSSKRNKERMFYIYHSSHHILHHPPASFRSNFKEPDLVYPVSDCHVVIWWRAGGAGGGGFINVLLKAPGAVLAGRRVYSENSYNDKMKAR